MKLYIASDHGGFELKERIKMHLEAKNLAFEDAGPHEYNPEDDYPDFVIPAVQSAQKEKTGAILICRNGVGVSILANKFKGIRAALCFNPLHAKTAREDDNSNVIALPAENLDEEKALATLDSWLETPFSEEERHVRRLKKVSDIENLNFK